MALIEVVASVVILSVAALGVTATIALVNSKQMRSAGGSSLDLQALSYARETLESLRNAVSTDATKALPLSDSTASCLGVAAGNPCGTGEVHSTEGGTLTGLPVGSDLLAKGVGTRTYRVWDISDGNDNYAYKKVTVTVQWTD